MQHLCAHLYGANGQCVHCHGVVDTSGKFVPRKREDEHTESLGYAPIGPNFSAAVADVSFGGGSNLVNGLPDADPPRLNWRYASAAPCVTAPFTQWSFENSVRSFAENWKRYAK